MAIGTKKIETYVPVVRYNQGLYTALPIQTTGNAVVGGTLAVTGAATITGGLTQTGALTPTGGIAAAGGFANPKVFHSGGIGVVATTGLTQLQVVTTETYVCEIFIPANTTLTGISVLNGHTTSASQHTNVGLANSSGTIVASSATTTTQAAADLYQQIPFSTTYAAVGPAKYFMAIQGDATTGYFAAFGTTATQNFGARKITAETYGTFLTTATYTTTTYTGGLGVVADTY